MNREMCTLLKTHTNISEICTQFLFQYKARGAYSIYRLRRSVCTKKDENTSIPIQILEQEYGVPSRITI